MCVCVCVCGGGHRGEKRRIGGFLEGGVDGVRKEDRQTLQKIVVAVLQDASDYFSSSTVQSIKLSPAGVNINYNCRNLFLVNTVIGCLFFLQLYIKNLSMQT